MLLEVSRKLIGNLAPDSRIAVFVRLLSEGIARHTLADTLLPVR